jgi:hypothetical protein
MVGSIVEKYHSVEMKPVKRLPIYQFKLHRFSGSDANKACLMVKPDSEIVGYLEAGRQIDMKYYPKRVKNKVACFKTKIQSISKESGGPFKGHYKVDISIVDER